MSLHRRRHPVDVPGCYGCKLASVRIGAGALPTRAINANQIAATEKQWQRDIPAYRSLRGDGVQPRGIDGAHEIMMRAETREQIEGLPRLHADAGEILTGEAPPKEAA